MSSPAFYLITFRCGIICRKAEEGIAMEREALSGDEKSRKQRLFLQQKETMEIFLRNGAITKAQYQKSLNDLIVKMGIEDSDDGNSPG